MAKLTLTDLANLQNETTVTSSINTNNALIEQAIENTLSRDGTAPNQMGSNIDMNSYRILNLPAPLTVTEPLRVQDVIAGNVTVYSIPTGGTSGQVLTKNSNTNYDVAWTTPTAPAGVPTGGTTGQFLTKNSNTDYDTGWTTVTTILPAVSTPAMDGTAAVGGSVKYAREDHVHPTDTSRAPLASPTFTGVPTAPTATPGTNTTQIATTAFVLANGGSGGTAVMAPQGRPTLTSGVTVTTTDVTGATNVYFTPQGGNLCPIYNGTSFIPTTFTELTLALDATGAHSGYHAANKNFDLFVFNDSGTIRLGTGPDWSAGAVPGSDTARGTGAGSTELQLISGLWTNKNSITLRWGSASGNTTSVSANNATYVGTFRTTSDGVTEDSLLKRFLYSAYNQARRQLLRQEPTASWTYSSSAAYQQARANSANQVAYVAGLTGAELNANVITVTLNSTSTPRIVYAGIGLDSTSVNSRTTSNFCRLGDATLSSPGGPTAQYVGYAQLGYHYIAWLEKGAGTDTQTWFGVSGSDYQTGIFGSIVA